MIAFYILFLISILAMAAVIHRFIAPALPEYGECIRCGKLYKPATRDRLCRTCWHTHGQHEDGF